MAQAQILDVGTEQGLAILSNPGRIDRWIMTGVELASMPILAVACAADQPLHVQAASASQIWDSTDGGQSWATAGGDMPAAPSQSITLSGAQPTLLRASALDVERSDDAGAQWVSADAAWGGNVSVLLATPYHPDRAFVGTSSGEIWLSSDRGRSWQRLKDGLAAVNALAVGRVIS